MGTVDPSTVCGGGAVDPSTFLFCTDLCGRGGSYRDEGKYAVLGLQETVSSETVRNVWFWVLRAVGLIKSSSGREVHGG